MSVNKVGALVVGETELFHQILLALNLLTVHLALLAQHIFVLLLVSNEQLLDFGVNLLLFFRLLFHFGHVSTLAK